jgi:hypothetical protein
MIVHLCDRCKTAGQLIPLLGKDICNACVSDVRELLSQRPAKAVTRVGRSQKIARHTFREPVERALRVSGVACAHGIAAAHDVSYRTVYFAMIAMEKRGELVNLGNGRFGRPSQAAE